MKTLEIKDLLKKDLLVVELPEKYNLDYTYYREDDETEIAFYLGDDCVQLKLFKGSYTLLGKVDEIREEDARELVEAPEPYWEDNKNQKVIGNAEWSYAKSLLSILESEIYWSNPIKIIPRGEAPEHERVKNQNEFEEAEHKTFDRNRTLIFVKN